MPDYQRLANVRRGLSAIMQNAGQTATWRAYQSASAGLAEYGQASSLYYVPRVITGMFDPVKPQEVWMAGGQILAGDVWVTTFEPMGVSDQLTYAGAMFQVVTEPINVSLFGTAAGRSLIRRA